MRRASWGRAGTALTLVLPPARNHTDAFVTALPSPDPRTSRHWPSQFLVSFSHIGADCRLFVEWGVLVCLLDRKW